MPEIPTSAMANKKIREDKICQNCGEHIEKKFCPECGQKNTESRRSFYVLFSDFFTTLLNYDNSFWRTLKELFISPGKLTREYMEGKRKKYLPPVQLYLFVSFLVFFIPIILPSPAGEFELTPEMFEKHNLGLGNSTVGKYGFVRSIANLDSIHHSLPENERLSTFEYYLHCGIIMANVKAYKTTDFKTRFKNEFIENLSKVIFIYMPIFAFFLWLFHGKKRWYYFDSGIFTLHFFSLILLIVTFLQILYLIMDIWLGWEVLFVLISIAAIFYITFYFFRAHHNYFGESTLISRLKAGTLIFINTTVILKILVIYLILVFIF